MWLLKDSDGRIRYLRPNTTVNVGRKQTDIVLENDSSISRAHATIVITLKDQMKISEESSKVIVKDINSKYGTTIIRNGIHIKVSTKGNELQPSDLIKFGLQHHIFKVEYIHFITVISRLSTDHKKKLKSIMDSIGGIIIDYYDERCTHLTATTATSTNKIISAIIAGIPIIDINYWMAVLNAIEVNNNLPDPNLFILSLQDKGVNSQRVSLKPNPLRKIIFQEKKFIFFSAKTFAEYNGMIKEAGGKAELYTTNLKNISDDLFTDNNIIMQITDDSFTDDVAIFNAIIYEKMQEKKLRMIAETEIPLALVYVSLDKFCNPKYHFKELIKRKSLVKDVSKILALDTQDILPSVHSNIDHTASNSKQMYIPETEDYTQESIIQRENYVSHKSVPKISNLKNIDPTVEIENSLSKINVDKEESPFIIKSMDINSRKRNIGNVYESADNSGLTFAKPQSKKIKIKNNIVKEINLLDSETKKKNSKLKTMYENLGVDDAIIDQESNESFDKPLEAPNLNIKSKRLKCIATNGKSNKRIFDELSDLKESYRNVMVESKNKEFNNSIEMSEKKRKLSVEHKNNDEFVETEEQNNESIKEQDKFSKWGFKKSEKKIIDFDLDDMDEDEPNIQDSLLQSTILNKESTSLSKEANNTPISNIDNILLEFNESDKDIEIQSPQTSNAKLSIESVKNWISIEPLKNNDLLENNTNLVKDKTEKTFSIRSNILLASNTHDKSSCKVFKKVYNQIPTKRILLSDMTIWKPNT
ncbi:PREDICTED: nibrin-like [Ceratosolen solmsi marchali]|uniref:Nibrin-like n=1 Tax=Ceratosolen solmsi marchali TaxID=326594 RepID=A0AAJ6YW67_9HYME|nr:PREDICTED: nibrin-like [Ceratosolen solmsi marchali]